MDWAAVLEEEILATGMATHAAMCTLESGSNLASSAGFYVDEEESLAIAKLFTDQGGLEKARLNGIELSGEHYIVVRASPRSIFAKKGGSGIICGRTKAVLIITLYDPPILSNQLNMIVERVLDIMNAKRA